MGTLLGMTTIWNSVGPVLSFYPQHPMTTVLVALGTAIAALSVWRWAR